MWFVFASSGSLWLKLYPGWTGFQIPKNCLVSEAKFFKVFAVSLSLRLQVVELSAEANQDQCKFEFNNGNFKYLLMLNLEKQY